MTNANADDLRAFVGDTGKLARAEARVQAEIDAVVQISTVDESRFASQEYAAESAALEARLEALANADRRRRTDEAAGAPGAAAASAAPAS